MWVSVAHFDMYPQFHMEISIHFRCQSMIGSWNKLSNEMRKPAMNDFQSTNTQCSEIWAIHTYVTHRHPLGQSCPDKRGSIALGEYTYVPIDGRITPAITTSST